MVIRHDLSHAQPIHGCAANSKEDEKYSVGFEGLTREPPSKKGVVMHGLQTAGIRTRECVLRFRLCAKL